MPPLALSTVSSWPGLVDLCITYAENEREYAAKSKKGLGESDVCRVIKLCVKAADGCELRSGDSLECVACAASMHQARLSVWGYMPTMK